MPMPTDRPQADHFICCGVIRPLADYATHMGERHDGRSQCVLQLAAADVQLATTTVSVIRAIEVARQDVPVMDLGLHLAALGY